MGTPSKLLEETCIYPEERNLGQRYLISRAVLNYVSYLSQKRQNLSPDLKEYVGFAILLLIRDSSWAISTWEVGHI